MHSSQLIDIPEDYICPITRELMQRPVVAADGHSYEKAAILSWLQRGHRTSPLTNQKLEHGVLIDNHRLKIIIDAFKAKVPTMQQEQPVEMDLEATIKLKEAAVKDYEQKNLEKINYAETLVKQQEENEMLVMNMLFMQEQMKYMQLQIEASKQTKSSESAVSGEKPASLGIEKLATRFPIGSPEWVFERLNYNGYNVWSYKVGLFITELWYKYDGGKWFWTPEKGSLWIPVDTLVVPSGKWKGQKPAEINQRFINWLSQNNPKAPSWSKNVRVKLSQLEYNN